MWWIGEDDVLICFLVDMRVKASSLYHSDPYPIQREQVRCHRSQSNDLISFKEQK